MDMDVHQAARAYLRAATAAAQHQEAATLAAQMVAPARAQLAALDPYHPLLQLHPGELPFPHLMHPLEMLVELFLRSQAPNHSIPVTPPQTALLAGSLALVRAGPGTAPPIEILRRVAALTRSPLSLER